MWHGEVLQMIVELKQSLAKVTASDDGVQADVLLSRTIRIAWTHARATAPPAWPIDRRLVEGQCKFLLARHLKGDRRMPRRRARQPVRATQPVVGLLNGDLKSYFSPPADCEIVAACQPQSTALDLATQTVG